MVGSGCSIRSLSVSGTFSMMVFRMRVMVRSDGGSMTLFMAAKSRRSIGVHHLWPEWFHRSRSDQQSSLSSRSCLCLQTDLGSEKRRLRKIGSAMASSRVFGEVEGRSLSLLRLSRAWRRKIRLFGTLLMHWRIGVEVRRIPLRKVESLCWMIQWSSGIFHSPSEGSRYLEAHLVLRDRAVMARLGAPTPPLDVGICARSLSIHRRLGPWNMARNSF